MTNTESAIAVTVRPAAEADLPAINAIYNREITDGIATWDTEPWSDEQRAEWLRAHRMPGAVALVAVDEAGEVLGFGYLAFYKERRGYRFTREDTLYVRPESQGRGVGRAILEALIAEARALDVHVLIARIEASNAASIALHEAFGFEITGRERETGFKFGEWRSLVQMEKLLPTFNDEVC